MNVMYIAIKYFVGLSRIIIPILGVMESGHPRNERRQSERSFLPQEVTYEVSTHLVSRNHSTRKTIPRIDSLIKDISEGGVCLRIKQALETAQIVKISLPLPNVKITTPALAEVRWVKKDTTKDHYIAGLRFLL